MTEVEVKIMSGLHNNQIQEKTKQGPRAKERRIRLESKP